MTTYAHLLLLILGLQWGSVSCQNHRNRHHKSDGSNINSKTPLFDTETAQDVTTTLGHTAFLHCRVRYLGDRRVLWMRQRDLHILTSSLHSYTNDLRISAIQTTVREPQLKPTDSDTDESSVSSSAASSFSSSYSGFSPLNSKWSSKWNASSSSRSSYGRFNDAADNYDEEEGIWSEWTLRIRSAQVKDAGLYECQVSTEPKISKIYRLHVVVSKATILGSAELFVKKGSDINLTCVISEAPESPLQFVWHHAGRVLNYSSRGGMSVTTDKIASQSRLLLARAGTKDSGNYTCAASGAHPASVLVHVLNGEQPAAMQRDNSANLATPPSLTSSCHFLFLIIISSYLMWRLSDVT